MAIREVTWGQDIKKHVKVLRLIEIICPARFIKIND